MSQEDAVDSDKSILGEAAARERNGGNKYDVVTPSSIYKQLP